MKDNKDNHKLQLQVPSDERNTRNPTKDDWCVLCIDIVASKYKENRHK